VLTVPDKPQLKNKLRGANEELKIQENYPSPINLPKTDEELESNNDEHYSSSSGDVTDDNVN